MQYCKNYQKSNISGWIILIGADLIILLLNGCGSKPKVYHVGILSGLDFFADTADGFKSKMTELGYIEDSNIIYDIQKNAV